MSAYGRLQLQLLVGLLLPFMVLSLFWQDHLWFRQYF